MAPVAEWDRFRELLKAHPTQTKLSHMIGSGAKPVELLMRKDVRAANIFYFDRRSQLQGRTSPDECEHYLALTVQTAPRKNDTLRVAICPLVRGWPTGAGSLQA